MPGKQVCEVKYRDKLTFDSVNDGKVENNYIEDMRRRRSSADDNARENDDVDEDGKDSKGYIRHAEPTTNCRPFHIWTQDSESVSAELGYSPSSAAAATGFLPPPIWLRIHSLIISSDIESFSLEFILKLVFLELAAANRLEEDSL